MSSLSVGRAPRGRALPFWVNASGSFAWLCLGVVVVVLVLVDSQFRSVIPAYQAGTERFMAHDPLYAGIMGYLYAPAYAVVTAPVWWLGSPLDAIVWLAIGYAVLTYAVVRQAGRLGGTNRLWMTSTALFFAIPMCAAAIRNGQSTMLLTGACWLLIMYALEQKPWPAAAWAAVALIAKPTALVVVLLVLALRPRMIPHLLLALLVVLALPFAFAPAAYVYDQTLAFGSLLTTMAAKKSAVFVPADFTAMLDAIGLKPGDGAAVAIRMLGALATLAAVIRIDRSNRDAAGALAIAVVAFFYMCVFNPRVETNTYLTFAPAASLAIAQVMTRQGLFSISMLPACALAIAGMQGVHPVTQTLGGYWLAPAASSIVFGFLAWWFVRGTAVLRNAVAVKA